MICTTCYGKRTKLVIVGSEFKRLERRPCPACSGLGVEMYDGRREQPRRDFTVPDPCEVKEYVEHHLGGGSDGPA